MRFALLTLALAACAQATGGQQSGDDDPNIDAPKPPDDAPPPIDAPPIDMGPTPVTLSQTSADAIGASDSLACGNNGDGTTAENSWYRVFRLADAGISTSLQVDSVTFGVQESAGTPAVQVKIGTYAGNLTQTQLDTTQITPIASATFNVPNTASTATTTVTVPVAANVPAQSQMIVEVFSPNLAGTGKYFYIGGNSAGESKPSYLRAPACGSAQPVTTGSIGFATSHIVIKVSGSY